jgi:hypothetical protein
MLPILVGIPVLILAAMLQSVAVSQIQLLNGSADIVLLTVVSWVMNDQVRTPWSWAIMGGLAVGLLSQLPVWMVLGTYLAITALALALKRRVWQIPLVALLSFAAVATLIWQVASFTMLLILGVPLNPAASFNLILLPSLVLNVLLAIPIQAVVAEIANLVHPANPDE